ncbi:PQ loop repeat-domain-containing protein, partial [Bipolaris maydis]
MAALASLPDVDTDAFSGICGTISIVAWVVVFSPQIYKNFRRGSCDGLSLHFLAVWLLGDIFNVVGAVLQGVRPTMIILAIYFTVADVVLLAQCFFYRGLTWKDDTSAAPHTLMPSETEDPNERTSLLDEHMIANERRSPDENNKNNETNAFGEHANPIARTCLYMYVQNIAMVFLVCTTGIVFWYTSHESTNHEGLAPGREIPKFDIWGQIFGWLCAALYFGSRFPQLILNWRRKSVEGLSVLFFLFACLGNSTYVLSILAFDSTGTVSNSCLESCEARELYGKHILVNLPWLVDGLGTMLLDGAIFAQFLLY